MSASQATHSYGSKIGTSTTSGGSYTDFAEVIDLGDDIELPGSNVTHLLSDGATKEMKPKLIDPGSATLKLNFTKAQYNTMLGYVTTRAQRFFKITLADGSIAGPWLAHISKLGTAVPDDDRITNDVTLLRSGVLAFTPAP